MKTAGKIVAVLVWFGTGAFSIGCHHQREDVATSSSVSAVIVKARKLEAKSHVAEEDVLGSVRAKLHAVLEAKISGRIERMQAVPGQLVKSREILAEIDARELQARLDQAKALSEQSGRDTDRLRHLLEQKAVSRQEFETVESRHRIAAASVSELETMLGYSKIVAPFDGVVTRKLADVGDLASPGRALLEIEDPTALRLEIDLPESLIGHVQLGAKLKSHVGRDAAPFDAVVSEIAPAADSASRTFNVKLDLPAKGELRAGQFARVSVPVGKSVGLRAPASAVIRRGQMEIVFAVVKARAQLRLVKCGRRIGDEIELVSGVEAGDQLIFEGVAQLRDGQAVEVRP